MDGDLHLHRLQHDEGRAGLHLVPFGDGGGRLRRQGARQAGAATSGEEESGGCSTRKAVVASPARTTGWETSQRRKGRFVVTPATSVSARASSSRASASVRVGPCAISFAIIGSYEVPTV